MKRIKKITALLLVISMFVPMLFTVSAQDETSDIVYNKSVYNNGDGSYEVNLKVWQTPKFMPLDIVMVLDVSGSMEYNVAVSVDDIDPEKDYYIEIIRRTTIDGEEALQGKKYKVINTASEGEEALWKADVEGESVTATPIEPGTQAKEKGEYVFYTGAIGDLKAAATGFVNNIAQSADENGLEHRIAVVEFSSDEKKSEYSLNTHEHSFYANILSGEKSPETALVSAKEKTEELENIMNTLTAGGPTYSDDALMQAKRIFEATSSEGRQRVVVLFTDGGPGSYGWSSKTIDLDGSSIPTANAAIACANEMKNTLDAEIYTIGFFDANEFDLAVNEKNKKYLAFISSNHENTTGMSDSTEPVIGDYCYINKSDSDIDAVFEKISKVLIESSCTVEIRDVVSRYFYMTEGQKKALTNKNPNAVITEREDGTTQISVKGVELTSVLVGENGIPVNSADSGIFKMDYFVTRKSEFIGGDNVTINTAESGAYSESGKKLSEGTLKAMTIPISDSAVNAMVELKNPTLYEGQVLKAEYLYENKSGGWFADFASVTYKVTDKNGNAFTSKKLTLADDSSTFTVTAYVYAAKNLRVIEKEITITVNPDTVAEYEITKNVNKTNYYVGDELITDGFELSAVYKSGKKIPVSGAAFAPTVLNKAGTQQITVSYGGENLFFDVFVEEVRASKVEIQSTPAKTEYFVGDEFDPTGIILKVTNNNGTTVNITEGFECSNTLFASQGQYIVKVTYDGKSTTISVNVQEVKAESLEVLTLPKNTSFAYKGDPDFTGLSVEITYNNGAKKTVTSLRDMTIQRVSSEKPRRGAVVFSVSAEGLSDTFEMESKLVWWQWIILICLLGFIWY